MKDVADGSHQETRLPSDAAALVFWVKIFGLRQGDVQVLQIKGPRGGRVVNNRSKPSGKNRVNAYRYVGKRRRGDAWPRGRYVGEYRLLRRDGGQEREVLHLTREVVVE